MSEWKQKRFWTEALAVETDAGFEVQLDGRKLRTPAKAPLLLPTLALAEALAAEWAAQSDEIDPSVMPFTRSANSAVDKVAVQQAEVAQLLGDYGASDLLCYRAEAPEELHRRQAEAWDPILAWAAERFQAPLVTGTGVMFIPQPEPSVAALRAQLDRFSHWQLAGFHDLVSLSGSLVIGLAAAERAWPIEDLWVRSCVDELWQEEQWGEDEEASLVSKRKAQAFRDAADFLRLCTPS